MVIQLNDTLDHVAFLVEKTNPIGLRRMVTKGTVHWLRNHLATCNHSLMDMSAGKECEIQFETLKENVLKYTFERIVEDELENFFILVEDGSSILQNCTCYGTEHCMRIGRSIEIMCCHCYRTNKFPGMYYWMRKPFMCYVRDVVLALAFEGAAQMKGRERKTCSLEKMCFMAECAAQVIRSCVVDRRRSFVQGAREAFNVVMDLDQDADLGWNTVTSPLDGVAVQVIEDEDQESHFQGHGSDDSQVTVPYAMPT